MALLELELIHTQAVLLENVKKVVSWCEKLFFYEFESKSCCLWVERIRPKEIW